jgi:hypothetical protein
MKFPRYWARGTVEVSDEQGRQHSFVCWGWSDESLAAAEAKGKGRAAGVAQQILQGERPDRYLYGDRPVREEVLETFSDQQGQLHAAVTRNSYGCHVLNTANVMFVDVDLPQPTSWENLKYRLGKLLGRSTPAPIQQYEATALARLETLIRGKAGWGARAYRTRAGLRYLFTQDQVTPHSDEARQAMRVLRADPLYVQLCRAQESFRARLTPKPWRCGIASPMFSWPWSNSEAEASFRQWEGRYTFAAEPYATCQFIGSYGNSRVHPAAADIVALHDRRTKANMEMQLA